MISEFITRFSQLNLEIILGTLSNSFILLRDITILLSSPSCFLNSPRASSSYTEILKEAMKYTVIFLRTK